MRKPPGRGHSRRPDRPGPSQASSRRPGAALLALAAVVVITIAAFWGAFDNGFVSLDDATHVTQNPLVLGRRYGALLSSIVNNSYHPVTMLSLAANASQPLSAKPFLVTNVLLHALNTALVFWLAYLLSRRRLAIALLTALLFGIHPMRVESVAWVSSRKDVLYVCFFLAGLIAYWRYLEKRAWPWLVATFCLFVLSCLSKAMAVVFPLILALLDYWKGRRVVEGRAVLEKIPFLAVSLLVGLIALDAEAGRDFHGLFTVVDRQLKATMDTAGFTPLQRVAFPTYGHMVYVWRLFAPTGLGAFYPYPTPAEAAHPKYVLSILFFAGTIALAVWSVRRARPVAFGIGWYLLAILPLLQWIPVGASMLADRMTYLAYAGLFLLLATGFTALLERYRSMAAALWAVVVVISAMLFALTTRQVETWRDSEALWSHVIQLHPRSDAGYISRGNARGEAGRIQDALGDFRTAVRLGSRRGGLYDGLGNAYGSLGKPDSAIVMFDRALELDPTLSRTYYNRAIAKLRVGRPQEALADLERAGEMSAPLLPVLHFPRANAFMQLGMFREAEAEFGRAIELDQLVADAYCNRGICRLGLGNRAGAVADFREALRIDSAYAPAREQLRALGE